MNYLANRKELNENEEYLVHSKALKTKFLATFSQEENKFISLQGSESWAIEDKEIVVFGPLEVRHIKAPQRHEQKRVSPLKKDIPPKSVRDYLSGIPLDEIAKELQISTEVLRKKFTEIGVSISKRSKKEGLSYKQLMAFAKKKGLKDIATAGNMSEKNTLELLEEEGLDLGHLNLSHRIFRTDKKIELQRDDIKFYLDTLDTAKLAENYGVSLRVINAKLEKLGALRPKPKSELTHEQLKAIIERKTLVRIAKIGEMDKRKVVSLMKKLGIDTEQYDDETKGK